MQLKIFTYVVNESQSDQSCIHQSTNCIPPAVMCDRSRDDERRGDNEREVPAVLPHDDLVLLEVADVRNTGLAAGFEQHPANVGEPETAMSVVRIEVGVRVSMVRTMAARPPMDGALDGGCPGNDQDIFKELGSVVRAVRPQTMISRRNPETRKEVECEGPDKGLPLECRVARTNDGERWNGRENDDRQPLKLVMKVGKLDWRQRFCVRQGV